MATQNKKITKKNQHIGLVKNDKWLEPFEDAIKGRHDHALWKLNDLTDNGKQTLSDFASGYLYFGQKRLRSAFLFLWMRRLSKPFCSCFLPSYYKISREHSPRLVF